MKKFAKGAVCLGLAVLMSVSFAACKDPGTEDPGNGGDDPPVVTVKDPVVVGEAHGYYYAASPADLAFNMRLNGGEFQSLAVNGTALTRNEEYKFNIGTEVLTIFETYLSTLASGDYTFTFATDDGSCDIVVTVGGSDLIEGYNMEFAIPDANAGVADHFFAKAARNGESVTFDFRTFGDFTTEGTSLKFINLLIDNAPFDDTGLNWRLGPEDVNVRLYSDGEVIYRKNFTGTEIKNGVANGLDNIWWKTNRDNPIHQSGEIGDVAVTREDGVTSFSLELPYEFLGIESTDDFRFALMECSDASSYDFNLYERGIVQLDGKALGDPVQLSNWPMFTAEGDILRPEEIPVAPVEGVPEGYDLSFAKASDDMYARISLAENDAGVTFDFWTKGDFAGADEFLNIYLDMPEYNNTPTNWCFAREDVNIRVYADGTVYLRTEFSGEGENLWYPRTQLTNENKLAAAASIVKDEEKGTTAVGVTVSFAELGVTKETFEGFRFWLAECVDNAGNFAYFGVDLTLGGTAAGTDARLETWPMFTAEGEMLLAKDIPADGIPEGYDLTFAMGRDQMYSKISYAEGTGVTFDFWTKGDFNTDGTALEFVQIYLDMPSFNLDQTGNWQFRQEDVVIRIYSDGSVYFLTGFNGDADNVWVKLDHETLTVNKPDTVVTKGASIAIARRDGVTSFSLTVTLEQFGIGAGETLESFRFYMAECSDNSQNDFALYASDLAYDGTAAGDAAFFKSYLLFTLAAQEVSIPS